MAYFEPTKTEFISSGSQLLDCVLGGGWAVGRVINLVGDRSSGKCCRNAYSITENGLELIDRIGSNLPSGLTDKVYNLAVNDTTTAQSSHFWKETVDHTIKIVTKHGYELEATPDHKIKIWTKKCEFAMKKFADLEEGDVAVISKSPNYRKTDYFKIDFNPKRIPYNYETQVRVPQYVDEKLGYLLGLLVADGNIVNDKAIHFSNEQPWFEEKLTQYLKDVFNIEHSNNHQLGSHQISSVQLNEFIRWLIELGERPFTARYKYIPRCILESPKSVQAAFLRALISCDSDWQQISIDYTTASETLAQDVHILLLNFGVVASRIPKTVKGYEDHTYWGIAIPSLYVNKFMTEIGSDKVPNKTSKATYHSDYEIFPFLIEKMEADRDELREKLGWSINGRITHPEFLNKGIKYFPRLKLNSYTHAQRPIITKYLSMLEPFEDYYNADYYKDLLKLENYHFDFIETIEHKYEKVEVYDYHIPDTHLFWSNGFISHNTLLAIEASVNLLMAYPDAYIWYVDAEAAFDESYVTGLGIPVEKFKFIPAETMEDVHNMLDEKITNANSKNHGMIIIDSYDALSDEKEKERGIEEGSYRTDKVRMLGEFFRRNVTRLEKKNITTIVVNQVRDVLTSRFPMKTKTGGNTLNHNASQIVWLSEVSKNEKTVNGIKRISGLTVKAKCTKNKVGMPFRECQFDILLGYGVDDLTSNLHWLKEINKPYIHAEKVLNTDAIITNFVKKVMSEDYNDFLKIRTDVATKVKTEWDIIEEGFRPLAKKYVGLVETKPEEKINE